MTDEAPIKYTGGAKRFREEINLFVYGLPRYYDNTLSGRIIHICQKCEHNRKGQFRGSCPVAINPFEDCERISDIIKEGFRSLKAIEARAFAEAVHTGDYDRMRERWDRARKKAGKAQREAVELEQRGFDLLQGCFMYLNLLENEISVHQHKLREEHQREVTRKRLSCKTRGSNVCTILKSHCEILSDDPERLSTDFLKKLIGSTAQDCP